MWRYFDLVLVLDLNVFNAYMHTCQLNSLRFFQFSFWEVVFHATRRTVPFNSPLLTVSATIHLPLASPSIPHQHKLPLLAPPPTPRRNTKCAHPEYLPVKLSIEDANLTFEAGEEEIFTSSDISDPINKDFVEEVLLLRQRKASLSTKYTAPDILLASKLVLPSSLERLKGGTSVAPFALALKREKI